MLGGIKQFFIAARGVEKASHEGKGRGRKGMSGVGERRAEECHEEEIDPGHGR